MSKKSSGRASGRSIHSPPERNPADKNCPYVVRIGSERRLSGTPYNGPFPDNRPPAPALMEVRHHKFLLKSIDGKDITLVRWRDWYGKRDHTESTLLAGAPAQRDIISRVHSIQITKTLTLCADKTKPTQGRRTIIFLSMVRVCTKQKKFVQMSTLMLFR